MFIKLLFNVKGPFPQQGNMPLSLAVPNTKYPLHSQLRRPRWLLFAQNNYSKMTRKVSKYLE